MYESYFVSLATSELGFATQNTDESRAEGYMHGYIGVDVKNKDDYLAQADIFLDVFEDFALAKIEDLTGDETNEGKVLALRNLIFLSKQLDLDLFLKLVGEDWDERKYNMVENEEA